METGDLEFLSLPGLWQEYALTERSLAFRAKSISEAKIWQQQLNSNTPEVIDQLDAPGIYFIHVIGAEREEIRYLVKY